MREDASGEVMAECRGALAAFLAREFAKQVLVVARRRPHEGPCGDTARGACLNFLTIGYLRAARSPRLKNRGLIEGLDGTTARPATTSLRG